MVDAVATKRRAGSVILEAIEAALATAAKKRYFHVRRVDPRRHRSEDVSYEPSAVGIGADDVVMDRPTARSPMDAVDESEGAEVGDYIEQPIDNPDRTIAAQAAKQ